MERRVDEEAIRRGDEKLLLTLRWRLCRRCDWPSIIRRPRPVSKAVGSRRRLCRECCWVGSRRRLKLLLEGDRLLLLQQLLSHRLLPVVNDDDDGDYMAAAGSPSRRVSDDKQSCGDADDDSQMADSITMITITRGSHPSSSPSTHSVPLVLLQAMHSTGHKQNTTSSHSHHYHHHHSSDTGIVSSGIVSFDPYPDDGRDYADCDDVDSDRPMRYCKPSEGNVMSRSHTWTAVDETRPTSHPNQQLPGAILQLRPTSIRAGGSDEGR